MKFDPEHAGLTYHEFLVTQNVKRSVGDIYSFKVISTLVVLEHRYRKIANWTDKFFFISSLGWEFPIGKISYTKFLIRAQWGVIPNDKVGCPTATP